MNDDGDVHLYYEEVDRPVEGLSGPASLALRESQTAVAPAGLLDTLMTAEDAQGWQERYEAVKRAIMRPEDYELYDGKLRPVRSYYEKISVPFCISVGTLSKERVDFVDDNGKQQFGYIITARASFPNGRYRDGEGACDSTERRFEKEKGRAKLLHDVIGTAQTRAENRAIEKLIGTGEVSYEEAASLEEQIKRRHANEKAKREGRTQPFPREQKKPENTRVSEASASVDRERFRPRIFAKINELAIFSDLGQRLKDDEFRHKYLAHLYGANHDNAESLRFNQITDDECIDFEHKIDSTIAKKKGAA